jgi:hypothetical protein
MENPDNPMWARITMGALGTLASPLALAEEYIARPITNVPFTMHNAAIHTGEHAARAYLWAQQGEYGEMTVDILESVKSGSEGFVAGASVAAPVAGAFEGTGTRMVTTEATGAITPAAEEELVSVYHGSIKSGPSILETGLDPARAPTFVSRDLAAAEDALLRHPDAVPGLGQTIESRIPRSLFDLHLAPLERPYSGFYPYLLDSTEITLRTPEHVNLFNQFIVRP